MSNATIRALKAREILDSRGNPTVEVEVNLDCGTIGRAAVPSGASTGAHEAVELRDGDKKRYSARARSTAVRNVLDAIAPAVTGMSVFDQVALDTKMIELDGTPNKGRLGANAILGVSMAAAHAAANALGQPLYRYVGGTNATRAARADDEHPQRRQARGQHRRLPGVHDHAGGRADASAKALRMGAEVFHSLKKVLHDKGLNTAVGDEGGFAPNIASADEALATISSAIEKAGYKLGDQVAFALDAACTELYEEAKHQHKKEGYCFFKSDPKKVISSDEMIDLWAKLCDKYPIRSIEDGLSEDDWAGLEEADRRSSAARCNSSATTCSSPTPSGSSAASPRGAATASS